ncbi:hypothetical protein L484_008411 [Morus notabilis]|uniref:Secreted protein n=1 Tax=Morus notabilis TaxID=981085 RepID=W9S8W7_9ROSA|nr:hypothetical protein L484_008411 [Morus notabilis]
MRSIYGIYLVDLLCFGMFICSLCQDDSENITAIYIVTLKEAHDSVHYYGELRENHGAKYGSSERVNHGPKSYFDPFCTYGPLLLAQMKLDQSCTLVQDDSSAHFKLRI